MKTTEADLVVIGAGPAGHKGAIQGAKAGKKVVLIDRLGHLGGACLNQGTVPSKTLRQAILDLTGFTHSIYFGQEHKTFKEISTKDLRDRVNKVVINQSELLTEQCRSNGIDIAFGSARFVDAQTVEVLDDEGKQQRVIQADKVLLATGSRPRHPIVVPNNDCFVDSDLVFRLDQLPESIIILGGGIIGCEYATMYAALGVKVILMDRRNQVLRMLDEEIGRSFAGFIEKLGVELKLNMDIEALSEEEGQAQVKLKSGEVYRVPYLFYSMGRVANVEGLNLEAAGISLSKLGYIPVNPLFQTDVPNIFAAGDVIGPPALASTSMEQGRLAVRGAFLMGSQTFPEFFPYGIYTIPEISSVGPTEEELKEKGINYEVGRAQYYEIARGPIAADTSGLIKLIFHAETLEVLGVHIIGTNATELIALGQMALSFRARVDYFVNSIFNWPTFAEGFRIAALNGLNKLESTATVHSF